MQRRFFVVIDLPLLRANLSREDGIAKTEADIERWLGEAGFRKEREGWVAHERDLGQLDPSEVVIAQPVDESA